MNHCRICPGSYGRQSVVEPVCPRSGQHSYDSYSAHDPPSTSNRELRAGRFVDKPDYLAVRHGNQLTGKAFRLAGAFEHFG